MESAVDKLESMFQKADADLDYLSRKLDAEFNNENGNTGSDLSKNPGKVLQKVAEIKKEYAEVVKEAQAIQDAQKEAMDFFRTELTTLCDTLAKLQQHVGVEAPQSEELQKVNDALGVLLPTVEPTTGTSPQPAPEQNVNCLPEPKQKKSEPKLLEEPPPAEENDQLPTLSPYELRAGSSEMIEITKDEFQSVSALIRGRVKISDVNQVYGILWSHFKQPCNDEPLTSQDMHKMGLKVTGHTGEAKLKVLRALKLLTISNKGHVKLL